jgi:hypothetical protein
MRGEKREGKDETEEEMPCDIYVLRFSLGLGDEMRSTGIGCERWDTFDKRWISAGLPSWD